MKRHFRAHLLLTLATLLTIAMGCSSTYSKPLVSRGLPANDRRDFIIQNGYEIPPNIRQAFVDGYVVAGMSKELVFQLYGAPDRASSRDTRWEYVNEKGQLVTGITFKQEKVETVYGDQNGGSRSPRSESLP